eukprot:g2382.t1
MRYMHLCELHLGLLYSSPVGVHVPYFAIIAALTLVRRGLPTPRGFTGRATRRGVSQVASVRYTAPAGFYRSGGGGGGGGGDGGGGGGDLGETEPEPAGDTYEPVAHFGLPVELELLHTTDGRNPLVGAKAPQIFLQVSSVDAWGRHFVAGYGYADLPVRPGAHDLVTPTWVPVTTLRSQMKEFFLGGLGQVDDLQSVMVDADHQGRFFSKHGMRSVSAGNVRLRLHVLHQAQPPAPREQVAKPARARKRVKDIIAKLKSEGRLGKGGTTGKKSYTQIADLVRSLKGFNKPARVRTDAEGALISSITAPTPGPGSPTRRGGSPDRRATTPGSAARATRAATPGSKPRSAAAERRAQRRQTAAMARRRGQEPSANV